MDIYIRQWYRISIHPMLFFILHMLYILSLLFPISIHPMLFFIREHHTAAHQRGNFNTSYVIFYLEPRGKKETKKINFNTSYVIFYPEHARGMERTRLISIHPMLFFIGARKTTVKTVYGFQYILCYFLSSYNGGEDWVQLGISIHPMLFFIYFWLS